MHDLEQDPRALGRGGGSLHLECMLRYKLGQVSTVKGCGRAPHSCNELVTQTATMT